MLQKVQIFKQIRNIDLYINASQRGLPMWKLNTSLEKKRLNAYIIGFLGLPKYSNRRCGQCRGATCQAVFAGIPDFTIGSNSTEITKIWVTPNPIRSPGIKKKSFIYKSGIPDFTIGLNSTEIMKISRPLFFPQGQRRFIMSKHVCRTSAA